MSSVVEGAHRGGTLGCIVFQPILIISAVVFSSRNFERSYPRSASSKKSVSSAVCLSSPPKNVTERDESGKHPLQLLST